MSFGSKLLTNQLPALFMMLGQRATTAPIRGQVPQLAGRSTAAWTPLGGIEWPGLAVMPPPFDSLSHRSTASASSGMLLKRLAYSGGVHMLEVAMAVIADASLPPGVIRSSGLAARREEAALRLTTKAFLQLGHAGTPNELAQAVRYYQRVQKREGMGRTLSSSDGLLPAMIELLAATETVARKGPRPKPPVRNKKAMTQVRTALTDLCLAIRH